MKLINLTPHELNIHAGGDVITVAPHDMKNPARVAMETTLAKNIVVDGYTIPVFYQIPGEVVNLPAPEAGTMFIVAAMVKEAVGRPDVVSPGPLKRNDAGQPIGCEGLSV